MSAESYQFLTKPIVDIWSGLLRRAQDAKAEFCTRGAQVEAFYSGGAGFMWDNNYISRFLGGAPGFTPPKFKITFNKSFEFIAVMGPMLFWQLANRKVKPYSAMTLDPSVLAGGDPVAQQYMEQVAQAQALEDARHAMRAQVQERILNWLPREQPGGGLTAHADLAVFEALLKGAGFLHTEPYKFPGSDRTLVGSFRLSCDDVFVDPDCRTPLWTDAGWIAIRHRNKWWELERYFKLPPGSLRAYASLSSAGSKAHADRTDISPNARKQKESKDIVEWYEIYSRCGVGNKPAGSKIEVAPEFDDAVGDFAYLCICPNCPYPLNLPSGMLADEEADDNFLREQLAWPTEYWRDNKWPISMLSFYPHSADSPWPEPPLSPAIGELTVLNIFISAYTQTVYDNSQSIIAVFENMVDNLQEILQRTKSPTVVTLKPGIHKSINDVLQFIKRPDVNGDVPQVMEFLLRLIERRVMPDMLYGEGGQTNSRSATEFQGRMQSVNIRPDYMRKRVATWMTEVAEKELFAIYAHMGTEDVAPQLGSFGALVWDQLVVNEDPEVVLRSSECYVEASDISRPTKERDAEMLQQMQQYLLPILAGQAAQTGNPKPFNGFIRAYGRAANMDVEEFLLPEGDQVDPAQAQAQEVAQQVQQATQQFELARQQAEVSKLEAEVRKVDAEAKAVQLKMQAVMWDAQHKAANADTQTQAKAQELQFRLTKAQQDAGLKVQLAEHAMQLKQQAAEHAMQLRERQAELQGMQAEHATNLKEREAEVQAQVTDAKTAAQLQAARLAQAGAQNQLEMASEQGALDLQNRAAAARQQLLIDLLKKHQEMQQAQVAHTQQLAQVDEQAEADARRANLIMSNKLLMQAAESDMRRQQKKEGS